MAIAFVANMGFGSSKTSGTTVSFSDQYQSGELIVIQLAMDNTGNGSHSTISVSDDNGLSYTQVGSTRVTSVGAGNGAAYAIFWAVAAVTDASVTITATFGTAMTAKVICGTRYSKSGSITAADLGGQVGAGGATHSITGTGIGSGDLVVGGIAVESNGIGQTDDSDTTNGSWSVQQAAATSGGGSASNMALGRQHKITTASGDQTWNLGNTTASDFASALVKFAETSGDATASPGVMAMVAAVPAATARGHGSSSPAATALVAATPAPTLSAGGSRSPAVAAQVLAAPAPTIQASSQVSLALAALMMGVPAPSPGVFANTLPGVVKLRSQAQQGSYLDLPGSSTNSWTSVPDASNLDYVDQDMEIEMLLTITDALTHGAGVHLLVSKTNTLSVATGGYFLGITTTGALVLNFGDGTNLRAANTGSATLTTEGVRVGIPFGLKMTIDDSNGSSVYEVKFWINLYEGAGWTQMGSTTTGATTASINDTTNAFRMGADLFGNNNPHAVRMHSLVARDSIGGTAVLTIDWTKQIGGTGTFVADTGQNVSRGSATNIVGMVSAGSTPTPAVAALAATMPAPTLQAGASRSPAVAATVLTAPTATASGGAGSSPAVSALVLAQPPVSKSAGSTPTPAVAALVLAAPAPTLSAGASRSPAVAVLVMDDPPVNAQGHRTISPAVAALVLGVPAASAQGHRTVSPAVAALLMSSPAPTLQAGAAATPSVTALVISVPQATGSGGSASTAQPAAVALVMAAPAPALSAGASRSPASAALTIASPASSIAIGGVRQPSVAQLVMDVPVVVLSAGGARQVAIATLVLAAPPSTQSADSLVSLLAATLTLASPAPTLSAGAGASLAAAALSVGVPSVTATGGSAGDVSPATVGLTLSPRTVLAYGEATVTPAAVLLALGAPPVFVEGMSTVTWAIVLEYIRNRYAATLLDRRMSASSIGNRAVAIRVAKD